MNICMEEYIRRLKDLVSMESPDGSFQGIRTVCEYLKNIYAELGLQTEIVEQKEAGCCLKAWNREGPYDLLLIGHMDTVFPIGTVKEHPFSFDDTYAYGPGVSDMKGGALLMTEIVRFLMQEIPGLSVLVAMNSDEETGSKASGSWLYRQALKSRLCLVLEPGRPGGLFVSERKGSAEYRLIFHGRSAHAGIEPQKGANAILELMHWGIALSGLSKPEIGTTVNIGVISGGSAANVVPDHSSALVDVRFESMEELERIRRTLEELKKSPHVPGVTAEVTETFWCPPMRITKESKQLQVLLHKIAKEHGIPVGFIKTGGSSDGNTISLAGIPVLDGCGPCGIGQHTTEEKLILKTVPERYLLLTEMLKAYFGTKKSGQECPEETTL